MNPFEFVIAIIAIMTVGRIIQTRQMAKYGIKPPRRPSKGLRLMGPLTFLDHDDDDGRAEAIDSAETVRLREEVKMLKERLQVIERITVEKENSLSREIDSLRDR